MKSKIINKNCHHLFKLKNLTILLKSHNKKLKTHCMFIKWKASLQYLNLLITSKIFKCTCLRKYFIILSKSLSLSILLVSLLQITALDWIRQKVKIPQLAFKMQSLLTFNCSQIVSLQSKSFFIFSHHDRYFLIFG